jgi:septal ring factor EnvC (AmiA/AmiB activator)
MDTKFYFIGILLLVAPCNQGNAQHSAFSFDDSAPRQYNQQIESLQEKIDDLRTKLKNSNLSLSEASAIVAEQSQLMKQADALWSTTEAKIDQSFQSARQSINEYNADNRKLEMQSVIAGSIGSVLNNVAKYPTREAFEANEAAIAAEWERTYGSRIKPLGEEFAKLQSQFFDEYKTKYGVDLNQTGYSRIGTVNGFTAEAYYKYYTADDPSTKDIIEGELAAIVHQNDANGYNKAKIDFATDWKRQRERQQQIQQQTKELKQFESQYQQSKTTNREKLNSVQREAQSAVQMRQPPPPTRQVPPPQINPRQVVPPPYNPPRSGRPGYAT